MSNPARISPSGNVDSRGDHGHLIVFEGPDGVGKTSVARAVGLLLRQLGYSVEVDAFPGNTPGRLGHLVYRLHADGRSFGVSDISPTSLQLLHIAAHIDAIDVRLLPLLQNGTSVVLDRFYWSTWVYGIRGGARRETIEAAIAAERMHWGSTTPAAIFLLHRSESLKRDESPQWAETSKLYQTVAGTAIRGGGAYTISNDGEFEETVLSILNILRRRGLFDALSDYFPDVNAIARLVEADNEK